MGKAQQPTALHLNTTRTLNTHTVPRTMYNSNTITIYKSNMFNIIERKVVNRSDQNTQNNSLGKSGNLTGWDV